jgi:hypothetical protein
MIVVIIILLLLSPCDALLGPFKFFLVLLLFGNDKMDDYENDGKRIRHRGIFEGLRETMKTRNQGS